MHLRTTFFLLVLALLLGALIAVVERSGQDQEESEQPPRRLLELETENVSYWSFARDDLFVECTLSQGQWLIQQPVAARADNSKLNHMLAVMQKLPRREVVTARERESRSLTLADYGLAKPWARLVLGDHEQRFDLAVGGLSPMKDAVYVHYAHSDEVIATATNLLDIIPRALADLRDLRLVPGMPDYVKGFEIKRQGGPLIEIVREGTEWVIQKPLLARADTFKVTQLLQQLFNLQIQQFIAEQMADPAIYGLSDDETSLQFNIWHDQSKTGLKLSFGRPTNENGDLVYAAYRGAGQVLAVSKPLVESLPASLKELRDARLYLLAPGAFAWIRIEEGEKALELQKDKAGSWQVTEPEQWKADTRLVEDLINRLNTLRIEAFLSDTNLAALGLLSPGRVIRVADAPPSGVAPTQTVAGVALPEPVGQIAPATVPGLTTSRRTLCLSRPLPGREYIYAKFEDEPQLYQLSVAAVATLALDPLAYRDLVVLVLDPATVTRIALRTNDLEQAVSREGAARWVAAAPENREVNLPAITALLEQISSLRVLRFEHSGLRDLGVYGLKNPRGSLTISLSGESALQKTLILGAASEDHDVYGMVQGEETVFVLPKALAEQLLQPLTR